jgi:hypothetical protein
MAKRRDVPKLDLDPGVVAWREKAVPNLAARTSRQAFDAARVRVRLDVPEVVKARLAEVASSEGTSSTQLGAFLLAWGLVLYLSGDEDLRAYLGDHCAVSRALRVAVDLDLEPLLQTLTKLADAVEE